MSAMLISMARLLGHHHGMGELGFSM